MTKDKKVNIQEIYTSGTASGIFDKDFEFEYTPPVVEEEEQKTPCEGCGFELPLLDFQIHIKGKDHFAKLCEDCVKDMQKEIEEMGGSVLGTGDIEFYKCVFCPTTTTVPQPNPLWICDPCLENNKEMIVKHAQRKEWLRKLNRNKYKK